MRTITVTALLAAAGIALTGCSSSGAAPDKPTTVRTFATTPEPATDAPVPDTPLATGAKTAACWKAIRDQYAPGTMQLTGAPAEPSACGGLSTDEVSAVASDVLDHQLNG